MPDISDVFNNGEEQPKKEFTSQDYEDYLKGLAPYEVKVYNKKEFLSEEDLKKLEEIKEELRIIYGLKESKLYGIIEGIIDFNSIRLESKRYEELKEEARYLLKELERKKESGTLTKEEEERIYKRKEEISRELEPWR